MARRRFIAPPRAAVDPRIFDHPVFAGFSVQAEWFRAREWPPIAQLNAALPPDAPQFVAQDQALLDDGLHYESRIAAGHIATRPGNWHDLFNAAVWCRYPTLKRAINARQCAHIAQMGPRTRNRAQYALTQFDEAGVIVHVRDPALLALWDRHDWRGLFFDHAEAWRKGDIAIAAVVGHALLEMALEPALYMVGKCLVVQGGATADQDAKACADIVARAVRDARALNDPLELRPLPLAGIPGWRARQDAEFYRTAECFQPLRAGRAYPAPLA
jgi:Protein of unknown function (DUF3025)